MFDIAIEFMLDFIDMLPYLIPFILIMNLVADLLWGSR